MITNDFPITEAEYANLEKKFGQLCHYEAWQLKKRNANNNYFDDQEDIVQSLRIAMIRAGSYYKRQIYIESCFQSLQQQLKSPFALMVLKALRDLWKDRKKHGANRQKFGPYQEAILEQMVESYISKEKPSKTRPLQIDGKFFKYCKQITWNEQRRLGKQITKDKSWRTGMISLSEFDYFAKEL
jgi:hypothetical protein